MKETQPVVHATAVSATWAGDNDAQPPTCVAGDPRLFGTHTGSPAWIWGYTVTVREEKINTETHKVEGGLS